jgi:hypothetical protein
MRRTSSRVTGISTGLKLMRAFVWVVLVLVGVLSFGIGALLLLATMPRALNMPCVAGLLHGRMIRSRLRRRSSTKVDRCLRNGSAPLTALPGLVRLVLLAALILKCRGLSITFLFGAGRSSPGTM